MKTIGIFFGSRSPEHDISIITAMRAMEGFKALPEYRIVPVYVSRGGQWHFGEELGDIAFYQNPRCEALLPGYAVQMLSFAEQKLVLHRKGAAIFRRLRSTTIDLAFPCFHGSFGEDGTIQGFFESAGIPYVGCGVLASAIAMSKIHTRRVLAAVGIPGVPTVVIGREEFFGHREDALRRTLEELSFPVFVKPNSLGSSIAVAKASNQKELEWALEVAFQFDAAALAEKAIENPKEVNISIIGHSNLIISETQEPRFRSAYQTFDEKYLVKGGTIRQEKGKAKSRIPADLDRETEIALKDAAARAYRVLGASGISRFDFLVDAKSGRWYLGEVNTLPGSLQAHLWEASGIPLPQLLKKMIKAAEERFTEEQGLTRVFSSSVLKK